MLYQFFFVLSVAASFWLILVTLIVIAQRRVIFSPPKHVRSMEPGPWQNTFEIESMEMVVDGGVKLEGWRSRISEGVERKGVVFYFGGRMENVRWAPWMSSHLAGWEIVAFNYRGFGGSDGRATERHVIADALAIYERFHPEYAAEQFPVAVMGRSLGSGVAVRVASEKAPEKLVLVSPYSSLAAVVARKWYLIPAVLFIRHKFESVRFAPYFEGDALIFVAPQDSEVSAKNSKRLAAKFAGNTVVEEIHGEHHKTLPRNPELQRRLAGFLEGARPY